MCTDRTTLQDQVDRLGEEIMLEEMYARDVRRQIKAKRYGTRGRIDRELIDMRIDYYHACSTIRQKTRELRDIVQNMEVVA